MRQALPIFWCLDYDTQVRLAKLVDDLNSIPPFLWKEWMPDNPKLLAILGDVDYGKFLRRAPSRSRA